jgi:hypothetical protein
LGCLPSELAHALDLLSSELNDGGHTYISVSVLAGVTRWSGDTTASRIEHLRKLAAEREWPVTLERAPWDVLREVGHYGAYRRGVGGLVTSLCGVFDERGLLVTPLGRTA